MPPPHRSGMSFPVTPFNNYPLPLERLFLASALLSRVGKRLSCQHRISKGRNPTAPWQRPCPCTPASRHLLKTIQERFGMSCRSFPSPAVRFVHLCNGSRARVVASRGGLMRLTWNATLRFLTLYLRSCAGPRQGLHMGREGG